MAITMVLAHEYGATPQQATLNPRGCLTLVAEQQADPPRPGPTCAGSPRANPQPLRLSTGRGLNNLLAAMIFSGPGASGENDYYNWR